MTNLQKISENNKRLLTLNNRYEKLLALNSLNHYCVTGNSKTGKYLCLILEIRKQRQAIWIENRQLNKKYNESLMNAKIANIEFLKSRTLTKQQLFNLTSPVL
jgi:hypothetical protein